MSATDVSETREKVYEARARLREQNGKEPSQRAIAKEAGVSQSTVSDAIKAETDDDTEVLDTAEVLDDGAQVSPDDDGAQVEPEVQPAETESVQFDRDPAMTYGLPLTSVIRDPRLQMRAVIDRATVEHYAEIIRDGGDLPPVEVWEVSGQRYLVEGWHRFEAHIQAGKSMILGHIHEGSMDDAILSATRANATHGLPRTGADRKRATLAAREALKRKHGNEPSSRMLADAALVSQTFASRLLKELAESETQSARVGKDGRTYDASDIGQSSPAARDAGLDQMAALATEGGSGPADDVPFPAQADQVQPSPVPMSGATDEVVWQAPPVEPPGNLEHPRAWHVRVLTGRVAAVQQATESFSGDAASFAGLGDAERRMLFQNIEDLDAVLATLRLCLDAARS